MPSSSWTAPPTFAANDTLTAANMTILGDDLKFLKNCDRARVYKNAAQTVANTSWEAVSWDAEDYDTNGLWGAGASSRLVAAVDGWYLVLGQVEWDTDADGRRNLQIRKNDTSSDATGGSRWAFASATPPTADECYQQIFSVVYLSATDHVRMYAYHSAGAGLDINSGSGTSWFAMTWMAD